MTNRLFFLLVPILLLAGCAAVGGGVSMNCRLARQTLAPGQDTALAVEVVNSLGQTFTPAAQLTASTSVITISPSQVTFGEVGNSETRQNTAAVKVLESALPGTYKLKGIVPYKQGAESKSAACEVELRVA